MCNEVVNAYCRESVGVKSHMLIAVEQDAKTLAIHTVRKRIRREKRLLGYGIIISDRETREAVRPNLYACVDTNLKRKKRVESPFMFERYGEECWMLET